MTRKGTPSPQVIGLVVVTAFALSLAALFAISRPAGAKARTAAIAKTLARAEDLERAPGDPAAWPTGAICHQAALSMANAYPDQLRALAAVAGVSLDQLNATAIDAARGGRVQPVQVRLTSSGPYSGQLAFLSLLSRQTPALLLESTDLRKRKGTVELAGC